MQCQTDRAALDQLARADRRKGKRVPLTFPIEVAGIDRAGRLFVERTMTCDVSECGCRFLTKSKIHRGDVVTIRLLTKFSAEQGANRPLLFEIVWVKNAGDSWMAGAKQLQPENAWHVHFPAPRFQT
jgi:hypothetical protein